MFSLIGIGGCAPNATPVAFDPDFNDTIVPFHKPLWEPASKDYALGELMRGQLFFESGDRALCDKRFGVASQEMGKLVGDTREGGAAAVDERSRTYRGSPYERCSLDVYRAICQYNAANFSGALAAARNAIANDAETNTNIQQHKEDFGIAYFLAALCYARLGERDNAIAHLELAKRCSPAAAKLTPAVLDTNLVGILAVGAGPVAMQGSFASREYVAQPCPESKIEIEVDGKVAAEAVEMTDLLAQAQSNKPGEADAAAKSRAVGKFVLSVVLSGASGSNVNIEENRDLRCWWGLPHKFYVFAITTPPGTHSLAIRCYDAKGKRVLEGEQLWYEYPIWAKAERLAYFRVRPNVQNYNGLSPQPLAQALADKRKGMKNAK
jgi:tetratricopeptide (TPR) repeat protein